MDSLLLLGLLAPVRAPVERAEAEVAMGDQCREMFGVVHSLLALEPHVLIGGPDRHRDQVDRMIGDPWPDTSSCLTLIGLPLEAIEPSGHDRSEGKRHRRPPLALICSAEAQSVEFRKAPRSCAERFSHSL